MGKGLRFLLIAVGIGFGIYSGVKEDEVLTFNDTIVEIVGKGDNAFEPVANQFDKWTTGQDVDFDLFSKKIDALIAMNNSATADMEKLDDDEFNFKSSAVSYLANNLEIAAIYKEQLEYMKAHVPANKTDVAVVMAALQDNLTKSDNILYKLQENQRKYASENDLKIEK